MNNTTPMSTTITTSAPAPNFIVRNWRGEYRFAMAYWVMTVLINIPLYALAYSLSVASYSMPREFRLPAQCLLMASCMAVALWQMRGIGYSAFHYPTVRRVLIFILLFWYGLMQAASLVAWVDGLAELMKMGVI